MSRKPLSLILLFLICLAGSSTPFANEIKQNDDQRFTALTEPPSTTDGDFPSSRQLAEIYSHRFRLLWTDEQFTSGLDQASDEQVFLRLRAAIYASFHVSEAWVLNRFEAVLGEAHQRSLAERDHFIDLYDALMAASLYDRAREIRQRYPQAEMPLVPEIIDLPDRSSGPDRRIIWMAHSDPPRLQAREIESDMPMLVVVSSPACGFCRNAIRELGQDQLFGPLVRARTIWLVKKSRSDPFRGVAQWNAERVETPMVFADHVDDWPMIDFGSTPRFYFLRDGTVQDQLFGWLGGEEAMWKIARGFDSIGLLNADELPKDVFTQTADQAERKPCPTYAQAWQEINDATPIRSREQLDDHLAQPSKQSPIKKLSPEAQKRLVASMKFGPNRVRAFRLDDLRAQLGPQERLAVARLFGFQYLYANFLFPEDLLDPDEQDRRNRLNCAGEYSRN